MLHSILVHGSPTWYTLLSQQTKETLEAIPRSATVTHIILPDHTYDDKRCMLTVPTKKVFIFSLCQIYCYCYFDKVLSDLLHPLQLQ